MATQTLTVRGMACDGCEQTVEEAVSGVEGVESATADSNDGEVTIETAGDPDDQQLRIAIEDAGYEVVG